jgi:carbon-monoxide dehydrogenase medium subunit
VKAPRFSYARPERLDEVFALLAQHGDDARILAGGQSLIPTLNMRLSQPKLLIDINRLDALKGISLEAGFIRIGALARHVEVMNSPIIARHLPLIAEAMPHIAHVAVRNRGTFGGSIALADPSAELPACVLALQADIVVQGARGRRSIAAEDFFLGLYDTARKADDLLIEVRIPVQRQEMTSVFTELARRHGDFAVAGLACCGRFQQEAVSDVRLVYFGSEIKPRLASRAMAAINGRRFSAKAREEACAALAHDLDPIDNIFGKPATKLHLQRVLTSRALDKAMERARLQ